MRYVNTSVSASNVFLIDFKNRVNRRQLFEKFNLVFENPLDCSFDNLTPNEQRIWRSLVTWVNQGKRDVRLGSVIRNPFFFIQNLNNGQCLLIETLHYHWDSLPEDTEDNQSVGQIGVLSPI